MRSVRVLLALGLLTQLCACVEIRDNKKQETQPMVRVQSMGDVTVDQDMYIYDGKILSMKELKRAQEDNADLRKVPDHDFEFNIDRLTITDRGHLYTLGNNVRFHVQDLKTTSGTIATFPENQTAPINTAGRPGGYIFFEAAQGNGGLLIFQMRGENGGKGLSGDKADAKLDGAAGAFLSCGTKRPELASGEPGKQGYKGKDGKAGGATGTLNLKANRAAFASSVERYPGKGGTGGQGGQGGKGGQHGFIGISGVRNCDGSIPVMLGERKADDGPDGEPGNPGPDGPQQDYCIDDRCK